MFIARVSRTDKTPSRLYLHESIKHFSDFDPFVTGSELSDAVLDLVCPPHFWCDFLLATATYLSGIHLDIVAFTRHSHQRLYAFNGALTNRSLQIPQDIFDLFMKESEYKGKAPFDTFILEPPAQENLQGIISDDFYDIKPVSP